MNPRRTCTFLALAMTLTLACRLASDIVPGTPAPTLPTPPVVTSPDTGADVSDEPDMLEATLGLRSVSFSLEAVYPDDFTRRLTGEIDAAGNLHVVEPFDPGAAVADTLTAPEEGWGAFELFVVDGRAYTRMPGESAEQDDTFLSFLEEELRGPDGPGLWLSWAGTEDLEPAAHEETGSFSAIRYPVDAEVEQGNIQGMIWVDAETLALIRAELTISPELFSTSARPANGSLTIRFEMERVEISPIGVP